MTTVLIIALIIILIGISAVAFYYHTEYTSITTTPANQDLIRIQNAETLADKQEQQELTNATTHAQVTNGASLLNELSSNSTGK